ncbi:MAG: efflux RND transporter periplasmic adaptor subunit [Polaromonas sp.]|nr:efflux RND transporter periplasmic adaptor subunit [Polaromonas sp.]
MNAMYVSQLSQLNRRQSLQIASVLVGGLLTSIVWAQTAVQVPVVSAQMKSVGVGFELDGVIQPVKQSTISSQASGRIATLTVKAGDKVKAGQVLATVDDRESQTGVQRSQAQMAQAQAELSNALANFNRTKELQAKGFVSKAALDTAESQFKSATAAKDQANAGAKQSALAQGFTRVTAPYDGWVLQTHAEAGDLAVPGKPLLTLYAPLPLRAVVQVPMSRASTATAAANAGAIEVKMPSLPTADGSNSPAQWIRPVSRSSVPTADAVSQTVEWRLELPTEAAKTLLPGQQVRVRFTVANSTSTNANTNKQANRMVVPSTAVLRRGELTALYVVSGDAFALKAVRLGADQGESGVEVLAGLDENDLVALDPVKAGLKGAKPIIQNTKPAAASVVAPAAK